MSERLVFLSEGQINVCQDKRTVILTSLIAEGYKQKLREISQKNEWKKSGSGALFMGMNMSAAADYGSGKLDINGIARRGNGEVLYSLNSESVGGIYSKNILNTEEPETYIFVKEKTRFYDIDINGGDNIVTSVSSGYFERHIALLNINNRDFHILTEGDSYDSNPAWSGRDERVIYYDSCGLGYDNNGHFIKYGPKSVYRLNINSGDLTEILTGGKFDFYNPYEDKNGNLYYIKRPYNTGGAQGMPLKDIILIPVKILKAIFGWLNFFTQRYSGESLKTNGNNPAKSNQKSPEQIFVDGNMLEAEKNLNRNKANGEKNPGYAPSSWELTVMRADGTEKVLKKGILDYGILNDGSILYSNGKYIIKLYETGEEEVIAKAHLALKPINFDIS